MVEFSLVVDSKRLAELFCALRNFDEMIVFYQDIIISLYNMCIYEFVNTLNIREFIYTNEFILSKEFKKFQIYFDKSLLDFYDYKNFKKYSPYRNSYQGSKKSLSNRYTTREYQ